jgi:hypothetical protein
MFTFSYPCFLSILSHDIHAVCPWLFPHVDTGYPSLFFRIMLSHLEPRRGI